MGDYHLRELHAVLRPNKWYDGATCALSRQHRLFRLPREITILAILDGRPARSTWRSIGPDFNATGQTWLDHRPAYHFLVPKGASGRKTLMVFDNGGWGDHGVPNRRLHQQEHPQLQPGSESNPITLETEVKANGPRHPHHGHMEVLPVLCQPSRKRLPNSLPLITEGLRRPVDLWTTDRLRWISHYFTQQRTNNMIYSNTISYSYVPQEPTPVEVEISH